MYRLRNGRFTDIFFLLDSLPEQHDRYGVKITSVVARNREKITGSDKVFRRGCSIGQIDQTEPEMNRHICVRGNTLLVKLFDGIFRV